LSRSFAEAISRFRGLIAGTEANIAVSVMLRVGVLTLGVRFFTFVRDILVARAFGVGDVVDAFVIAYLFPSLFINVLAASLNVSLIPVFMSVRRESGDTAAGRLLGNLTFLTLGLLVLVSALLAAGFPSLLGLLGGHLSVEKRALTYRLFLLVLPTITLGGLSTIWGAVLNANNRFFLAATTPALAQVTASLALLLLAVPYGIYALAGGLLIGQLAETTTLGLALRREGFSPLPGWHGIDSPTRQVLLQYAPMVAGATLMSGTNFVDQSMAAVLPAGSVAALSLGGKVPALLTILGSTAVGTVALPHFSRLAAERDVAGLRKSVRSYLRLVFLVSVPITALLLLGSRAVVHLVFERGAFTPEDTVVVGRVLVMYAFQIPFYIGGIVLMRLLSALGGNERLLWLSLLNFINNVALNLVLMRELQVAGLALSTSFVIAIWFACCWVTAKRRLTALESGAA
jgi:putative peptidoglycan lipid II flippase